MLISENFTKKMANLLFPLMVHKYIKETSYGKKLISNNPLTKNFAADLGLVVQILKDDL